MTPRLFYKLTRKVERSNVSLIKTFFIFLTLFLSLSIINAVLFDVLIAIILVPLGGLFLLYGLWLLKSWYKDDVDKKVDGFDLFWKERKFIGKLFLWCSSFLMLFWLIGITFVICFSVIHTILFVIK